MHKVVSWSRQACRWSVRWCWGRRRRRCCTPDVYPISFNGTAGNLHGVRSCVACFSDTAIRPSIARFACHNHSYFSWRKVKQGLPYVKYQPDRQGQSRTLGTKCPTLFRREARVWGENGNVWLCTRLVSCICKAGAVAYVDFFVRFYPSLF